MMAAISDLLDEAVEDLTHLTIYVAGYPFELITHHDYTGMIMAAHDAIGEYVNEEAELDEVIQALLPLTKPIHTTQDGRAVQGSLKRIINDMQSMEPARFRLVNFDKLCLLASACHLVGKSSTQASSFYMENRGRLHAKYPLD